MLIKLQLAVGNNRLKRQTRRHADELASLVAAATSISSTLDLDEVYQVVAEQMAFFIDVDICAIVDQDRQKAFITRALFDQLPDSNLRKDHILTLAHTPFIGRVLTMPQPMQTNLDDPNLDDALHDLLLRYDLRSLLVLPLIAQNQNMGIALLIDRKQSRVFQDSEISLVQTLNTQAAIAVQNARLYSETQRQLSVTKLLNESSQVINSSLDLNQIMKRF